MFSAMDSRTKATPAGKPPAMPLAPVMRSGVTPTPSPKKFVPVRPKPVCTSSKIKYVPFSVHASRNPSK